MNRRQIEKFAVEPLALEQLVRSDKENGNVRLLCRGNCFGKAGFGIVSFHNSASARVKNFDSRTDLVLDALKRLDEFRVLARVVRSCLRVIGKRPNDGDRLKLGFVERQKMVLVGEQDNRFLRGLESELAMRRRIDHFRSELGVRNHLRRIEFSEAEADGQYPAQRLVDIFLRSTGLLRAPWEALGHRRHHPDRCLREWFSPQLSSSVGYLWYALTRFITAPLSGTTNP